MSRAVIQQALEIMNAVRWHVAEAAPHTEVMAFNDTITALREALAQPEQEVDYWIRQYSAARDAEMKLRRELEALAQPEQPVIGLQDVHDAITADPTLAYPEQSPAGTWMGDCIEWTENPYRFKRGQKLYTTAPPQRQPQGDEK